MRIVRRMIHSSIWHSDQFTELSLKARLLYIGLITIADDEGRVKGDGRFLKNQIFPYDRISAKRTEELRDAIRATGLIEVYPTIKGACIAHPNWEHYQKLDKRRTKPSDFPPLFEPDLHANAREVRAQGNGMEVNYNRKTIAEYREKMLAGVPDDVRKRLAQKMSMDAEDAWRSPPSVNPS